MLSEVTAEFLRRFVNLHDPKLIAEYCAEHRDTKTLLSLYKTRQIFLNWGLIGDPDPIFDELMSIFELPISSELSDELTRILCSKWTEDIQDRDVRFAHLMEKVAASPLMSLRAETLLGATLTLWSGLSGDDETFELAYDNVETLEMGLRSASSATD